jgi:WD40 repeat protein
VVSPDGRMRASSSFRFSIGTDVNGLIYLESDAGQSATLEGHASYVVDLAFSPDGTLLASGGWDHAVWLWDVATGEEHAVLHGYTDLVSNVAFSPDGATLAAGSADGTVRLWDTATGEEREREKQTKVSPV